MPGRGSEVPNASREVERLLGAHPRLGLPIPAYGGRSVPNLTATVAQAVGTELGAPSLPPLADDLDPFAGRRSEGPIVVLLVDGLGYLALERHRSGAGAARLPAPARQARPISSVFLTTTTVALTSLSTAAAPAAHGVVGHRQYLPRFGAVADLLRMSPIGAGSGNDLLVGNSWSPSLISGVPSIFRRGVPGVAVSRERFATSGFTRLLYDGAEYVGYSTLSEFALLLRSVLARDRPPPVVFAYWDDLDTVHHLRGPSDDAVEFEVEQVVRLLEFARRGLPATRARATTVLVTADHGHVPLDPERELKVDRDPALLDLLRRPSSGDRRAGLFAARPGRVPALREALDARLPPGSRTLLVADALEAGLFGPPPFHPELEERLGDVVALPAPPGGIAYTVPGRSGGSVELRSAHGGLTPEELLVPLLAGSLEEWAAGDRAGTKT
jgi:hypothetical protein